MKLQPSQKPGSGHYNTSTDQLAHIKELIMSKDTYSDLLRMLLCEIWMWVDISERVLMFKMFDGRKVTSFYGG